MSTVSLSARPLEAGCVGAATDHPEETVSVRVERMPLHAGVAILLATLGVVSLWPTDLLLWSLWTTDPLKSIGVFVPWISLWLTARIWRSLLWESDGTWWGMAVLVATLATVHLRDGAVLELVITPSWSITLPPHSVVAFAYASGMVLLFGGTRLWRAAFFPLALMLLVNPVPHVFTRLVDQPLQHVSAEVARGLAHALGQHLTPDQLYLMFTPEFGMFIAPGCNGLRGSVTMGLIALVAGYLYQFRRGPWAALVGAALLLGYVFNLLRLCVLVVYYVVALPWPWLQKHAEAADYAIGAALFFVGAMLLFAAIRRFSPERDLRWPGLPEARLGSPVPAVRRDIVWRAANLAAVLLLSTAPYARGWMRPPRALGQAVAFPAAIGSYRLRRTWPERLDTGQTIFAWAEYAKPGTNTVVSLGISPLLGAHDTLLCHAARGESWIWHGGLELQTSEGPVAFTGTLFQDEAETSLEASTVCTRSGCGQWASERRHMGLVYSRPSLPGFDGETQAQPIPVLLVAKVPAQGSLVKRGQERELVDALQAFSGSASFGAFTSRYLQQ